MSGKILRPLLGEGFTTKRETYCRHQRVEVCSERRTVTCGLCGASLDPFDVLKRWAQREERQRAQQEEEHKLREHLDALREEEERVKARTKNASRKDAETAVAAAREQWVRDLGRAAWTLRQIAKLAEKAGRQVRGEQPKRKARSKPVMLGTLAHPKPKSPF